MARTVVGINDPKAVKRYGASLAVDTPKESFFGQKMMGEGEPATLPIQRLTELENDAGEQITFDLSVQLKQEPIEGDNVQEGTEEDLGFYTDAVYIDQMRCGANGGGRMTRKRTLHKLRDIAKKRMAEWWARVFDEVLFIYLSGARGINAGFVLPTTWAGRANNAITAPDSAHLMVQTKHTKATLVSTDKMDLTFIDRAISNASTMGGGTQGIPRIQPIKINGETHYVCVLHPWQEFDLRTSATTGQWLDIQKAAATALGKESPIFKGGLGMYNNVVLQKHENIIRFSDYGAGANVLAARALFLGVQAAVCAFGSPGTGLRFDWYEEARDNGNQVVISSSSIFGTKKVTFNGLDYGVIAMDTAAADPNA